MTLSQQRRAIHPRADDDWQTIASRELTEVPVEQAVSQLQSWNLHVFMRPAAAAGSPRENNPILPSDIIFIEPPRAGDIG